MENKLNGLISLLGQSHNLHSASTALSTQNKQSDSPQPNLDELYEDHMSTETSHDGSHDKSSALDVTFPSLEALDDLEMETTVAHNLFTRGILTFEKANVLLSIFRNMSIYFPFVLIPIDATVQSMSEERPFFFLAVMATASSEDKPLQKTLDLEFRTVLSTKVVLEGEKSIDLLQGLLIYLAWSASLIYPLTSKCTSDD